MSDEQKRDAVLMEFRWRPFKVTEMADEIARLRDENGALRAAVERVLALHAIFEDWCDSCNCVAPCPTIRALEVGRE